MNLKELFEVQRKLDERIEQEHPRQDGEDRLGKKILALQVELGECANEWRGFKFWSKNQNPTTEIEIPCDSCGGSGRTYVGYCGSCHGGYVGVSNPLLEEYVDCLHFILSIGLEKEFEKEQLGLSAVEGMKRSSVTNQFNYLFDKVGDFSSIRNKNNYMYIINLFIGLGEMLGFTQEEIKADYMSKNAINHARQENGY